MSLAIEAGSKATLITTDPNAETSEGDVYVYEVGFPERLDGLPEGIYHFGGEAFGFDVGSASRYYAWLELLSKSALGVGIDVVRKDPQAYAGRPFVELIDFSDNEGAIGPKTSRKLAGDFAEHAEHFRRQLASSEHHVGHDAHDLIELYEDFQRAFELAGDEGFVVFQ